MCVGVWVRRGQENRIVLRSHWPPLSIYVCTSGRRLVVFFSNSYISFTLTDFYIDMFRAGHTDDISDLKRKLQAGWEVLDGVQNGTKEMEEDQR